MRKSFIGVTADQLRRATSIREEIDSLEQELSALLSGGRRGPGRPPSTGRVSRRGRKAGARGGSRKISAAGRKRISDAAKARWAKFRAKQK